MTNKELNSDAYQYIKTLKDSVKRRFAVTYLEWIRGGRSGPSPSRGALASGLAKAVSANLDSLA